jgi:hypothetical protein
VSGNAIHSVPTTTIASQSLLGTDFHEPGKHASVHEADQDPHERDAVRPDCLQAFGNKEEGGAPDQTGDENEEHG